MVVNVNGIQLHWETTGDGEPLLWLHGAMGCGEDWRYIFGTTPEGFRVIAPDQRGHGSSTHSAEGFTFRQSALDIIALLRYLNIPRTKAIGLSGGGITLLHMATIAPDLIESMVLVSAPPYFPEQTRRIQRQFSLSTMDPTEVDRLRARHTQGPAQLERLVTMARQFADNYDDVNFTPPYLASIAAETLIVFGDRDPLYPVSLAVEMRLAIPHSYLWVVPNGGHGPVFREAAAQFSTTALQFLRGGWHPTAGS